MRVRTDGVGSGATTGPTGLPDELAGMPPGPELARTLEALDRTRLNGHRLVLVLQARARQLAQMQAEFYADMLELAHCPPCGPDDPPERLGEIEEFASDEIRAALTWTRRAADYHLDLAWRLVERLPAVWQALHGGRIDLPKARLILNRTDHLDEAIVRQIADEILPEAEGLTTGQLRARLDRLCVEADPQEAADRYEKGVGSRHVGTERRPDGTADLYGVSMPADRIAAIVERIARIAQKLKTKDETRTMDQLRSDVFLDLLEGRHHRDSHHHPVVDIRVELLTLLGLNEKAGEIPGWGPVVADIARRVVERQPDGEWRVTVVDPDTNNVRWDGTTRRRPTAAQRRYVEARQTTCTFPGCRNPARASDMDHAIEVVNGGQTLVDHLEPACRHDHRLRHEGRWKFEQPQPGVYTWTSPHGHTYVTGRSPP